MKFSLDIRWFALAVPIFLTACDVATSSNAETVKPGSKQVDPVSASSLFSQVCVKTYPNISAATTELGKLPFTQNPRTKTYYHHTLDLSFKLTKASDVQACSMVFGSTDKNGLEHGILMSAKVHAAGISNGTQIGLDAGTGTSIVPLKNNGTFVFLKKAEAGNRGYYNAVVKKK